MASSKNLPLTLLLVSGVVVLGAIGGVEAACDIQCIQGGYITCSNYPGQKLDGCDCQCKPSDGEHCVLHLQRGPPFSCS